MCVSRELQELIDESNKILSCISNERLSCYFGLLQSLNFQRHKEVVLLKEIYCSLQTISSTLFVPLHFLEVALRNKVNEALSNLYRSRKFQDPEEWYRWMPSEQSTKKNIASAIYRAGAEIGHKRSIIHGDIISRLNFGTWVSLLEEYPQNSHQYYFWPSIKKDVFAQAQISRGKILFKLRELNKIRNRLFHYEPIWKGNNLQDVKQNLDMTYADIVEVVDWISPECSKMLGSSHRMFEKEWKEICEGIYSHTSN